MATIYRICSPSNHSPTGKAYVGQLSLWTEVKQSTKLLRHLVLDGFILEKITGVGGYQQALSRSMGHKRLMRKKKEA
jgi:hypothetical protein